MVKSTYTLSATSACAPHVTLRRGHDHIQAHVSGALTYVFNGSGFCASLCLYYMVPGELPRASLGLPPLLAVSEPPRTCVVLSLISLRWKGFVANLLPLWKVLEPTTSSPNNSSRTGVQLSVWF